MAGALPLMAHFILVHGFNDRSAGAANIDQVAPLLVKHGHTVDTDGEDYGYMGLLTVRFGRHGAVARVVNAIRDALAVGQNVVVVGYSNGFNFSIKALRLVTGKVRLAGVHPASPARFTPPDSVARCWIAYTRSDWAVRAASYVGWLIPGWGRLGAIGYQGSDARVSDTDYSDVAAGHGGLWRGAALRTLADDLTRFAEAP